jgi:MFS family permease
MVETLILPAIETLVTELAPDGSQSTFFGALSVASAIGGSLGYYAGSWMTLNTDGHTMWPIFSGVAALGFALSFWFVRCEFEDPNRLQTD